MRYQDIHDDEPGCTCMMEQEITETKGDDDILSHLKLKYAEFNELYFDGKLPVVPIIWGTMKNSGAAVKLNVITHLGKKHYMHGTMKMVFSNKYKRSAEQLEPLLLHEMVHVHVIAIDEDVVEMHGRKFMTKLKQVSAASGVDIPLVDTTKELELSDSEAKPVGIILRRLKSRGKIENIYAMFTAKTLIQVAKIADMEKTFNRYTDELIEARIVTSSIWWEKFQRQPAQRNINYKTTFWRLKPEDLDDLLANSRVVWSNGGSYD